jgi:3'-phosphoadenosine 5'-phosphosulfate sulfotransferase (PAPS reductase)/FAD synthetase
MWKPEYIVFVSGGNDSVALVGFAYTQRLEDVAVVYTNTGWASPTWAQRVHLFSLWVELLGFRFYEVQSEGMDALITRKKAFPANKPKFCTYELKILPALRWMDTIDPERAATCCVGIRREESEARATWPEYVESSENHGGRPLWSPLVRMTTIERDALLRQYRWSPLPHRSRECSPCVNSNRADLRMLPVADIEKVRAKEQQMGLTMFRPYRYMGATGIDEVVKWANSERGQYQRPEMDCDSGMCGG